MAALKSSHLQTNRRAVNQLLGMLEADFVLSFGLEGESTLVCGFDFGNIDVVGVVGLVNNNFKHVI